MRRNAHSLLREYPLARVLLRKETEDQDQEW